jgi:hypothetical protein
MMSKQSSSRTLPINSSSTLSPVMECERLVVGNQLLTFWCLLLRTSLEVWKKKRKEKTKNLLLSLHSFEEQPLLQHLPKDSRSEILRRLEFNIVDLLLYTRYQQSVVLSQLSSSSGTAWDYSFLQCHKCVEIRRCWARYEIPLFHNVTCCNRYKPYAFDSWFLSDVQ